LYLVFVNGGFLFKFAIIRKLMFLLVQSNIFDFVELNRGVERVVIIILKYLISWLVKRVFINWFSRTAPFFVRNQCLLLHVGVIGDEVFLFNTNRELLLKGFTICE